MVVRKPLELLPEIARGFVRAMKDYFAEGNPTKRDAIAAHQISVLHDYLREKKLRLEDMKEMYEQRKGHA